MTFADYSVCIIAVSMKAKTQSLIVFFFSQSRTDQLCEVSQTLQTDPSTTIPSSEGVPTWTKFFEHSVVGRCIRLVHLMA